MENFRKCYNFMLQIISLTYGAINRTSSRKVAASGNSTGPMTLLQNKGKTVISVLKLQEGYIHIYSGVSAIWALMKEHRKSERTSHH